MKDAPVMVAIGLVEDEIFGGVSTPDFGPLLLPLLGLIRIDLESSSPVASSSSALTMVIVSWISLTETMKLAKCQY